MSHFKVTITVEIPECEDEQEAIDFVEDNIGLSEFHLEMEAKVITDFEVYE